MSNYTRAYYPGGTFFFTLVTFERRRFLTTPIECKHLKRAWRVVQNKYWFYVNAICLLPDHLHCIMTLPENDTDYALRWRAIKGLFSRYYRQAVNVEEIPQSVSRMKRKELPIWQRRFWEHLIRNEDDFRRHVEYIHFNPVKHGLVSRAIDYPWFVMYVWVIMKRTGVFLINILMILDLLASEWCGKPHPTRLLISFRKFVY